MSPDLDARALEWVGSEYMLRWLGRLPDVAIEHFGEAWGACRPASPEVDFLNMVHRLLPADAARLPLIVEHYRAAGVRPWLELMPTPGFEELADALDAAGGRQTGFLVVLERELEPGMAPGPTPPGVTVERVGADVDDFAMVLPRGHGVEEATIEQAIAFSREHAGVEGARLYLARVGGEPAAAAVLFLHGDLAYLANASTLEPFRRLGCQGALIRRRLTDAVEAGFRRACVLTGWGSQSHANLVRAGFRTAYTKAVWRLDRPR